MSGGISSNYNSGGNIYTTGWRGAGSASGTGSAGGVGSGGSAGSFGSTAMGSAAGSFGNWGSANGFYGNGSTFIEEMIHKDNRWNDPDYQPDGTSNQKVDAPFDNFGYLRHVYEEETGKRYY